MKTDKRYTTDKKAARCGIAGTLLAALLLAFSCSQEDMLDNGAYPADGTRLVVTVTDGGYQSSGEPQTRAVEKGYATEFTEGDAAGLFAVNAEGRIWIQNIKVTAEKNDDGTVTWDVQGQTLMHTPETKYFLYYPFQNDAHNKVDVYAETAEDFFKPLIDEWKPKEDQSRYADYTASDLMVAKGVVETVDKEAHSVAVNFTMKHCMALAVIEMPGTLYHITSYNSKTTKCDFYFLDGVEAQFEGNDQPYRPEDHPVGEGSADYHYRLRYIVRPDKGYTQNGEYMDKADDVVHNYEVAICADDLKAGCYTLCKVDGGLKEVEGDYHYLEIVRIGDLFCPTANLSDWYLVPHEVEELADDDEPSGIVFQTDKRRFGSAETDFFGGREAMHRLVVSVKKAESAIWSNNQNETGLADCTTLEDCYNNISGFYNHTYIKENYNGFDNFPAFKAADEHGKTCPIPIGNKTTGWYLPAAGQVWDIYQNLGDCQQMAETEWQTSQVDIADEHDFRQVNLLTTLNKWMEKIPSEGKDEFSYGYHRTSSEYNTNKSAHYVLSSNYITFMTSDKTLDNHIVRPVLAF